MSIKNLIHGYAATAFNGIKKLFLGDDDDSHTPTAPAVLAGIPKATLEEYPEGFRVIHGYPVIPSPHEAQKIAHKRNVRRRKAHKRWKLGLKPYQRYLKEGLAWT